MEKCQFWNSFCLFPTLIVYLKKICNSGPVWNKRKHSKSRFFTFVGVRSKILKWERSRRPYKWTVVFINVIGTRIWPILARRWADTETTSDISSCPSPCSPADLDTTFLGLRTWTESWLRTRTSFGHACPLIYNIFIFTCKKYFLKRCLPVCIWSVVDGSVYQTNYCKNIDNFHWKSSLDRKIK